MSCTLRLIYCDFSGLENCFAALLFSQWMKCCGNTQADTGTNALVSAVKAAAQQTTSNDAIIATGRWNRKGY